MTAMMSSPMFGIVLCILCYYVGVQVNRKFPNPLTVPLLVGAVLAIAVVKIFNIPLELFDKGGDFITMLLGPATAMLALSIYRQVELLKKHFLPIICGCLAGAITSMTSVFILGKLFGLEDLLIQSLLPKSVTTAIAMGVSEQLGGIVPITVASVVITGIFGTVMAPIFVKLFRVKDPTAVGVAIGSASHALGTSKALEMGEIEGAMSGISVGISGLITVLLAMIFRLLF